jgi:hypothetical protein
MRRRCTPGNLPQFPPEARRNDLLTISPLLQLLNAPEGFMMLLIRAPRAERIV